VEKKKTVKVFNEKTARSWILALMVVGSFMVALDALVVTTVLSMIRQQFSASVEELEWVVNAYTLSLAVLLMMGAALGDRFGRRRVLITGLGLFVAASAACAFAKSPGWLIAARTVQGAGAAMVMPLAVTLVGAAYPPEQRARALGIFSGAAGLAVLSGPVIGGAIAQGISWEWVFWLNVPIGLLLIPLILRFIPESFGARTRLDIGGLVLVTGAALGVVWGLVRGNSAGWGSLEVVGTLVAGLLLMIAFVLWELRVREPMLPMGLFRSRTFSAGNTAAFLLFASLYGSSFFLAQFLQTGQGYGAFESGLRLLPWTIALFITAPIAGSLVNRLGGRTIITTGLFLQGVGMSWIGLIASPTLAYPALIAPLIIAGCGTAMVIPSSQNAVISAVPPQEIGKASGTFNMIRQLGAAFGVAILVAVFSGSGNYHSAQTFSNGFVPAIGVAAVFSFLGVVVGLLLPGGKKAAVVTRKTTGVESREVYSALEA
jgi:EmrB/QacA subfamily drug resistance transporter